MTRQTYNHSNIYELEGKWFRICPNCQRHNQHTTKNGAQTNNRVSDKCHYCQDYDHSKQRVKNKDKVTANAKPDPKATIVAYDTNIDGTTSEYVFKYSDGKWARKCRQCGKISTYPTRGGARYRDKESRGCSFCYSSHYADSPEKPRVQLDIKARAKALFDAIDKKGGFYNYFTEAKPVPRQ